MGLIMILKRIPFHKYQGNTDRAYYTIFSIILVIICYNCFGNYAHAQLKNEDGSHPLLIEEIPAIQESLDNVENALDEGNYTLAQENIAEIQSGNDWLNIQEELKSRNLVNQIISFNNSITLLNNSVLKEQSGSVVQVEQALREFEEIINLLSKPMIDYQRLILTISIPLIIVVLLTYSIPIIRRKLNIRY